MIDALRQDVSRQWESSPLLRLGSWSIGLILLVYLLLWMDDRLALEQLEWRRSLQAVAESRSLAQQDYWPGMVEALEQQRQRHLQYTWEQRTTGLAQAAVREFINASVAESVLPLRVRSIELAEPQEIFSGMHEMRGRFTVSTEETAAPWGWIAELEQATPAVFMNSMEIRVGRKSGVAVVAEFRVLLSGLGKGQAQ